MNPPPLPDPLVGTVVAGRFRIERRLAEGGFGAVYRAMQLSIGRAVALKLLNPGAGDAAAPARFAREARALGRLSGPNVVRVLDYGVLPDGRSFLAMELLDGEPLDQSLARGQMSIPDIVAAGIQLCRALEEAHAAGIVHRDIKPSNIFVQRAGAGWLVKLIDFGAALRSGEPALTAAHYVVGTPSFLSPEQIRGQPADARSDLYGLGLVLFEMLTGFPPFTAQDTVAVLSHHLHTPPPRVIAMRPETPPALDALVAVLLSKSPDERFQSAQKVRAALTSIANGTRPREAVVRPPQSKQALLRWGALAALAATALVVGTWGWLGSATHHAEPTPPHANGDAPALIVRTVAPAPSRPLLADLGVPDVAVDEANDTATANTDAQVVNVRALDVERAAAERTTTPPSPQAEQTGRGAPPKAGQSRRPRKKPKQTGPERNRRPAEAGAADDSAAAPVEDLYGIGSM